MTKLKIAYQGEPGANSHIACADVFPDMEPMPCATFEDALSAISEGTAALGMIPIENSLAGRVADIHQFLPTAGLHIIGEYFLPIRFQLMAIKGARIDQLTDVYSHVHALGQCRRIIRQYGLKAHVFGDTAGSARQIAEWRNTARAAIAQKLADSIYDLDILAENVEDA
ncbi:MAG: prephenate dehydratase, partial [Hyphomicrobiales bacterium]|nr:prephenate dehydratase [Hyphomicrobiales bacterium]